MYKLNTDFEAVALLERFVLDMSHLRSTKEMASQDIERDVS